MSTQSTGKGRTHGRKSASTSSVCGKSGSSGAHQATHQASVFLSRLRAILALLCAVLSLRSSSLLVAALVLLLTTIRALLLVSSVLLLLGRSVALLLLVATVRAFLLVPVLLLRRSAVLLMSLGRRRGVVLLGRCTVVLLLGRVVALLALVVWRVGLGRILALETEVSVSKWSMGEMSHMGLSVPVVAGRVAGSCLHRLRRNNRWQTC